MPTAGPRVRRLAHPDADVRARALGLPRGRPVLVVLGTAGALDTDLAAAVLPVLRSVLARASAADAVVVTSGADAGVTHLVGLAAESLDGRWPRMVGVAPSGRVAAEDAEPAEGELRLNVNHDTAVLVPGSKWGEELPALFRVVDAVAGRKRPAPALLVGGDGTARSALVDHLSRDRPLLVLAGTGGLADEIAAGTPTAANAPLVGSSAEEPDPAGPTADPGAGAEATPDGQDDDLAVLVRSGQVAVVHLDEGADKVVAVVRRVLGNRPGSRLHADAPPPAVWPRFRFRAPEPHPVIDPGYVLDYPLLADAIHDANQLVAPALHESEEAALRSRERARLLTVLALAAGFGATVFAALQVWLRDQPWPGVLLAASGAAAAVLAVVARGGEDPEAGARAERLRALYFDHLAAPPAADDAEREERARELATAVARLRHGSVDRP
ncbi:hypothetical protein ACIGNX_25785 [Actinosynnema sp. NPDC053489]|uniref:hypothetical protein n=1 Tax=Actinosynnema sp. NPDC053489 TaxID=3363916 RepID=UPI0037C6DCC2